MQSREEIKKMVQNELMKEIVTYKSISFIIDKERKEILN